MSRGNKEKAMSNLFIADSHFGHANVIKHDGRPFETIEEMDQALIANWNSVVTPNDNVYILGDFSFRAGTEISRYTKALNGHLHLIRGNHDKRTESYEACFESVHDMMKIQERIGGERRTVILSHYFMPFAIYGEKILLYGHTHNSDEWLLEEEIKERIRETGRPCLAYNVGCMHQNYYPWTLEQIINGG